MNWLSAIKRDTLLGRNLRIDALAFVFIAFAFIPAGWFLLHSLETKFLESSTADALKVDLFIEGELDKAQGALLLFAKVKETDRLMVVDQMYDSFSDLYRLNDRGQVQSIYKAVPNSRVFEQFAFTVGPVWDQLLIKDRRIAPSAIIRGYEDALPSVYIAYQGLNETILGRLTLDYLRNFIEQYDEITGNILLVTSQEGVVMVSGRHGPTIPSVEVGQWAKLPVGSATLQTAQGRWIAVVKKSEVLGAWLVVLIPTTLLDTQRNIVLLTLSIGLLALVGVIILKSRQIKLDVLAPIQLLLERMRAVEAGDSPIALPQPERQLREFAELDQRFQSMSKAIEQRTSDLEGATRVIQERESELRRTLQSLPIPLIVFQTSPPGKIVFVNNTFSDLLGYEKRDLSNLQALFLKICPDTSTAIDMTQELARLVETSLPNHAHDNTLETIVVDKQGDSHDVIVAAILLEETAIATFVDITRLRQSERELLKAKLKAEDHERQKSAFFAMMSHEIRTPLTSIMGTTQLLQRLALSPGQQDLVARLSSANQFMLHLINDILDHSKIEVGELQIELLPFQLDDLLKTCDQRFSPLASQRGIEFNVSVNESCPTTWVGDVFRIEQILSNLVSNAIKFTEAGTVMVDVSCGPVQDDACTLRFDIRDTGVGIMTEALAQIFVPFRQSDNGIARRFGGTGLGLSISKRLVDLMNGEIGVDSESGKGSHFWFSLPLRLSRETAQPAFLKDAFGPLPTEQSLLGKNILVVEDSLSIRILLSEFLILLGAQVLLADDGVQALQQLDSDDCHVDAVIMDLHMPNMDGIDCTRNVRSRPRFADIPILMMTAGMMGRQRQQVFDAGAWEVMEKPIDLAALADWLTKQTVGHPLGGLPSLPGIDRQHAVQTVGDNPERFRRLFEVFLEETERLAKATRQDIRNNDRVAALRRMHTLKGNAAQIGALSLKAIAQALEDSMQSDSDDVERLLDDLDLEFAKCAGHDKSATDYRAAS